MGEEIAMVWRVSVATLLVVLVALVPKAWADTSLPEGTLVMHDLGPGNTTVFYIRQGKKEPIPNWNVFTRQGWEIGQVKNISQQELDNIPTGPIFLGNHEVVALPGPGGTTYEIENGQKRPIPDPETFAALGYSWSELVRLPPDQMASIPDGPPIPHTVDTGQEHEDHSCIAVVEFCQTWHFAPNGARVNDGAPRPCGACIGLKF